VLSCRPTRGLDEPVVTETRAPEKRTVVPPNPTYVPSVSRTTEPLVAPTATPSPTATPVASEPTVPGSTASSPLEPQRPREQPSPVVPTRRLSVKPGTKAVAGAGGLVVSVNSLATQIGLAQLNASGNAVDAAIATAFALAVTHPSAGNIGGGGFALVRLPNGETYALDFRESSPSALERERFFAMIRAGGEGPDSVAIPGTVAGLIALSERFGKTPLAELVEPARKLAKNGHVVQKREAEAIAVNWPRLKGSKLGKARWGTRDDRPRGIGHTVVLPELAKTLELIRAQGRAGFYEGRVAESIRDASGSPPQINLDDLKTYRAIWRTPLSFEYRGLKVTTMPPPSAGGVALTSGLRLLNQYNFATIPRNSTKRAHLLLEVIRRAQADRLYSVVDPDTLSNDERNVRIAQWLDPTRWNTRLPIELEQATPNERLTDPTTSFHESTQTTHLAVVDSSGMAVSLTTTLSSGFGSKVVTDTGIVLNNSLGSFSGMGDNRPAPARRTVSSMAPTLIDDADGLRLVLGTPGGDTIPSTLLQLVNLVVDYQVPLDEAIDAPRLHQSVLPPGNARSESRYPISPRLRKELERMGHHFTTPTGAMGHANSIVLVNDVAYGYADPREGGLALGLKKPSP
jgi:gamma-glutamyltranspeptidase/glutathione hydrolase